jgi:erythronate-4-phosphate dehydrogenase
LASFHNVGVKIVCASSVLFAEEAFNTLGETVVLSDRQIARQHLSDAHALVVRSKTPVNADLLDNTPIEFVGTATAGFDHLDVSYLEQKEIAWCAAPGCNANSVAEYVTAAICYVAHLRSITLSNLTLGVIGVGQVGSRVAEKGRALGMRVLLNDPPLAISSGSPIYRPLEEVLAESDIITLHVPLTRTGKFATYHMCNCHFFEHVKPNSLFINAARGEVVDTESLLYAMDRHIVADAVLDTWENEPFISPQLLARVRIATAHIAGYSFEGRLNGTVMVYKELCHYAERDPVWTPDPAEFPPPVEVACDARGKSMEAVLCEVIRASYDIREDDAALREAVAMAPNARGTHFDRLRRTYRMRREFSGAHVKLSHADEKLRAMLRALGFVLHEH